MGIEDEIACLPNRYSLRRFITVKIEIGIHDMPHKTEWITSGLRYKSLTEETRDEAVNFVILATDIYNSTHPGENLDPGDNWNAIQAIFDSESMMLQADQGIAV